MIGTAAAEGVALLRVPVDGKGRRLDAVDVAVVAEADTRGLAGDHAQTGTGELLMRCPFGT